MPSKKQPEIIPPGVVFPVSRLGATGRFFSDENLDILAHLLDDCFRVPGTEIRFGIDGIVGLIPAVGDVLTGLASCILIFAAWVRGVPYVTLARMGSNLAIDVLVGAVPFLGDVFDVAWKANRRNYKLLIRHIEQPRRHTWKDWLFLAAILLALAAIFLVPLVALALIIGWMSREAFGVDWHFGSF